MRWEIRKRSFSAKRGVEVQHERIADVTAQSVDLVPVPIYHLEGRGLPARNNQRKIVRSRPNEIKISPNSCR
jgi:hypothetical protein